MDPFTCFITYKKNLADLLRNASTTAYCMADDPWCTHDQSNTVENFVKIYKTINYHTAENNKIDISNKPYTSSLHTPTHHFENESNSNILSVIR